MRCSILSAMAIGAPLASAVVLPRGGGALKPAFDKNAPALPLSAFPRLPALSPDEVLNSKKYHNQTPPAPETETGHPRILLQTGSCTNPRVRVEWDSMADSDKQGWINAVKCMLSSAPDGQFSQSKNRWEDLVSLHQTLTPQVHNNQKFLFWHRYFMWTAEDIMRTECGLTGPWPWWDETKVSGNFPASSIFSDQWLGAVDVQGQCVTNGQLANLALNVGPGPNNQYHCLQRNNNNQDTAQTGQSYVNGCLANNDYAGFESCFEGGPHAQGHNGIGATMADMYASPEDPTFWLHHGFVDRNWRIWQNADNNRLNYVDGVDHAGNPLTMQTVVNVYGMRPDVTIQDIINTEGGSLCYKYNY